MMHSVHFASYYRWLVATAYWGLPDRFSGRVLDVGAHDGYFLSQIQAPFKVGVDLAMCELRPQRLVLADAQRMPFDDNSIGDIFAFDIIEHIVDEHGFLNNVLRILQPGGTLWLSTTADGFFIFPGGNVQRRLEKSWGHVRTGYAQEGLLSILRPFISRNEVQVDFFLWNEPFFRMFYLPLKLIYAFSPELAFGLIRRLVHIDSRYAVGRSGHLFMRVVK